ncbi:Glycosyltransferase involved in cell wall bisynthesis [Flavobacterium glycines]|uniref:Glycosyltransferase n=1 Tax=Flavobacterium glycines TaxID=551990 RepID=A0A1B9DHG3_9FLAO|nr:glycosyltransferase family 2 protein [Flavobacterium glycines]OCB69079.1 glycosyltransferase [Flavobacterium glycines]GEL11994.1 sugar transferase [Flavobacterium glycines]SDJ53997.1 Glycosyltransferase involved in cell wall bisynthesis [Flavobacterium glycines]
MKSLTVFTPSYNRAYLLPQLYKSLCNQTSQDFEWLIIDDGSMDETRTLVASWQQENEIHIEYIYQENQGMHGAHNTAYENIQTEFNVCIDSDDFMPDNAVAVILQACANLEENYAGILGLDTNKEGEIIGTVIPENLTAVKLNELYSIHQVKGDKKIVYRTAIVKKYPKYPLYENERFVPLDYLYLLIDQDYDLKPVNEVLCIVEYQADGSSMNILKQYRKHPNGFAFSRVSRIKYGKTFKERFKNAIHLVSSAFFAKELSWLYKTDKPVLVFTAMPVGVLLNLYIRYKTR